MESSIQLIYDKGYYRQQTGNNEVRGGVIYIMPNQRPAFLIAMFLLFMIVSTNDVRAYQNELAHSEVDRIRADEDIREVVFRYLFANNASGQGRHAGVYCLSTTFDPPTDPSDELIRRFAKHKPAVRKVSDCVLNLFEGVRDRQTGKSGLIFRVCEINWISKDEVEVIGGYYEGGLSASGNTYRVRRKHGKWIVVQDKMNWIS